MNLKKSPDALRLSGSSIRIAAVLALAIGLVLVASHLSAQAYNTSSEPSATPPNPTRQDGSLEEQLVRKFAPVMYLREQAEPCGGGEPFDPGPVSLVLGQENVVLREIGGDQVTVKEAPDAADLFDKGEGYQLDWPGNPRDPGCTYEEDYRQLRGNDGALIYAHIATEEGHTGFAVQYFFFYYYNDFLNKHEGDWEKIQLAFDANSVEEALSTGPVRVAYSGHAGGERADWNSSKLTKEAGRPVVYVAEGSHASYFEEGRYLGVARGGGVFGCEDTRTPHRRVDPAVQLLPDEVTDPNDEFAWIEYEGLWGQYEKSGLYRGISGPKQSRPWSEPFSWEASLRSWSEKLPDREALGYNPFGPFCFVVARGSTLLNRMHENPLLVGGGTLLLVGSAFGLLLVGVPQRVFGTKVPTRPDKYTPFEFRRHRNLGQIGRAAVVLYRRNLGLFVMIGGSFVVLGTLASSIQGPVAIRDVIDSPFAEAVLVFTAGGAQALIALLIIEASITSALREEVEGRSPLLRNVYHGVLARFWRTVAARLRASIYVIALFVSVVGIPWAVHRSVAWLFTEQMVILEDQAPRDALAQSRSLVRGSWLRVLGFIIIFVILLVVPGTIIAVAMLLFARPPASDTVYLVNGLLYGLLIAPMFAISKVLLYFDLRTPIIGDGGETS